MGWHLTIREVHLPPTLIWKLIEMYLLGLFAKEIICLTRSAVQGPWLGSHGHVELVVVFVRRPIQSWPGRHGENSRFARLAYPQGGE